MDILFDDIIPNRVPIDKIEYLLLGSYLFVNELTFLTDNLINVGDSFDTIEQKHIRLSELVQSKLN